MANAAPNGRLMTGAIGNFLLAAAFLLIVLTGGLASLGIGGMTADPDSAGFLLLLAFLFIIAGGVCGGLGYFGLASMHGGTNALAGVFSIIMGVAPLALIVIGMNAVSSFSTGDMSESGARNTGIVTVLIALAPPALVGIFGGLGVMSAKGGLAKPAGLIMLLGGLATAALTVFTFVHVELSPSLAMIIVYVAFFGLALGALLTGVTMIGERQTS